MSAEISFHDALDCILHDPEIKRFELIVGNDLCLALFSTDELKPALKERASQLGEMAAMRMEMRKQAETCEHEWSEPAEDLWGQLSCLCVKGCGERKAAANQKGDL